MAFAIGGVPAFVGEGGFDGGGGAEAEMGGVGGEMGHGANANAPRAAALAARRRETCEELRFSHIGHILMR